MVAVPILFAEFLPVSLVLLKIKKDKMICSLKKEIKLGSKIEMEHSKLFPKSKQKIMAKKIALAHIKEYPCYYSKGLIPMEKRLNLTKLKGG